LISFELFLCATYTFQNVDWFICKLIIVVHSKLVGLLTFKLF